MYKYFQDDQMKDWENMIASFAKEKEISFSRGSDIFEACGDLGIDILAVSLEKDFPNFDGLILIDEENRIIGVNDQLETKKARFVIAHELSHYINNRMSKHKSKTIAARDTIYHDKDKSPEEDQMDYMAAAILVPREEFKEDLKAFNLSGIKKIEEAEKLNENILSMLASRYNVEKDVIIRRIVEVS